MKKLKFHVTLFIFCYVLPNTVFSQWVTVGNSCISSNINTSANDVKLAFDNTTPYIVYRDGLYGNKATVKMYNGTSWITIGSPGFSAGAAYYVSIAIYGGTPYVAYSDGANSSKATVMSFNGTNWINVGNPGFSSGTADNISLIFFGSMPCVAYMDGGNGNKATVMKYDGTSWVNVGNPGFSAGAAGGISIAFNGSIYVAYADGANSNKATVMNFDGTNWVNVGNAGFSTGIAYGTNSIAFNGSIPYVAYTDGGNSNKATVMKFDGTNWVSEGISGFSPGQADYLQLAINNGIAYVAYRDLFNCGNSGGGRGSVMKYDGTNWVSLGNSCFTSSSINVSAFIQSIVFNNNEAYVAYSDPNCGTFTKATVMKFQCNTVSSIIQTACYSYTLNNQTYTTSGVYSQSLTSTAQCDSTITLTLTIDTVDTSVVLNGNTLTANTASANYQWIDCNNANAPIPGQTNQSFTATANGNYAVIVTQNSCSDTSICYNITTVGINESVFTNIINVYPNPSIGKFTVEVTGDNGQETSLEICNLLGEKVYATSNFKNQTPIDIDLSNSLKGGLYFVKLYVGKKIYTKKIVIQ